MALKGILFMATTEFAQLVEGGKPMMGTIQVVDDETGRSYGTQSVFVGDPQVYAQVRQFVESLLPSFSQEAGMPCELAQPVPPPPTAPPVPEEPTSAPTDSTT